MNADGCFLAKRLHFYLLLAVVATTLTSWFLVNSLLILFLTGCRLLEGRMPAVVLRTAFSSPAFLAFFVVFLLEVAGFFHTLDPGLVWMHVQRKATLVAISFVIAGGPFTDGVRFRQLLRTYCLLLAGLCCCCLVVAMVHYGQTGDDRVFFYHLLTEVLGINAIYFSAYVLMALVFLFSGAAHMGRGWVLLSCFFTAMMVLLASKLLLVVLVIVGVVYLWRHRAFIPQRRLLGRVLVVAVVMGMLACTDNPVARRYRDILPEERSTAAGFNGVSLRLFIWRSAEEILTRRHAWVFGVSAGDSQDLLNQRYLDARMSVGYLDYNFHNEYIEVLVDDGLVGLVFFLAALAVLGWTCRRTLEGVLVFLALLVLAGTESTLEMQHSVFLTCFFVMLPWKSDGRPSQKGASGPTGGLLRFQTFCRVHGGGA
jgi:O-antigen ligase